MNESNLAPFNDHPWLRYDAQCCVLICTQCQYAIQRSAIESHLLRHKIYRGERQQLLSSISALNIVEPEDVQLPEAGSQALHGLPVIPGYRCSAANCGSLFASTKRMRRHWSEIHGVSAPSEDFAENVLLQTLFRGTKLKYFEVVVDEAERAVSQPVPSSSCMQKADPGELDLDVLKSFYHYSEYTSHTLPGREMNSDNHWKSKMLVTALDKSWLMFALLAISHAHAATMSNDEHVRHNHQKHSLVFFSRFLAAWLPLAKSSLPNDNETLEIGWGAQLICVQRCYYWSSDLSLDGDSELAESVLVPFSLRTLMHTIMGCVDPVFAMRVVASNGESVTTEPSTKDHASQYSVYQQETPPLLVSHLRSLPFRMTEAFGRPERPTDVLIILTSIQALIESAMLSYASEERAFLWDGMERWLSGLPARFFEMVQERVHAALVVLAHWAVLVDRAGSCFWFLAGFGTRIFERVIQELPKNAKIHALLDNLVNNQEVSGAV